MHPNFALASLLFTATAALLPAQNWIEVGDAGQTLDRAQVPDTGENLITIQGQVGNDADLFLIDIRDPSQFSAVTTGSAIDSQLWLFDDRGIGVCANDDLNGQPTAALNNAFVKVPGRYYLAVTAYNLDPNSAAGQLWGVGLTGSVLAPQGAGRFEPLTHWSGAVANGGAYTITLAGARSAHRHVVLPDSHNLSESQLQATGTGSPNWWRPGGGRFQILYEGSNFIAAGANGATGGININRIMFRAEDGLSHPGGMVFPFLYVRVATTSLTPAAMSATFATNLSPSTTTELWNTLANATVQPSIGSVPNNYNLVLEVDDFGPPLTLNPYGAQPNLLIEVNITGPAYFPDPSVLMVDMQDSSGGVSLVRGRGLTTGLLANPTGNLTDSPIVMGVDFSGIGGGQRVPMPARNEYAGAACGGAPASFYQPFVNGQKFDLRGLRLTPDNPTAPTTYTVTGIDSSPDVTKVNGQPDSIADDATVPHALGFMFRLPGSTITAIRACTNGFVWLDGFTTETDYSPGIGDLLASPIATGRLLPFWTDLMCGRNVTTHANSGLHVRTDTSGGVGNAVCYVTWLNVGNYQTTTPGSVVHTFQCVLREATGVVEFRYGSMARWCAIPSSTSGFAALTGFVPQRTAASLVDPQSRDLSLELPFSTAIEGSFGNMGLDSVSTPVADSPAYGARLFAGQTVKWNVTNVPPGSLLGVQLLDTSGSRPGASLPTITAPGCMLSTSQFATLFEVDLLPGTSVSGSNGLLVPSNPTLAGTKIYAQYIVLGGLFGAPDLITVASNTIEHTVGRR